jgi:hypothetical protein
LAMHMGVGVDGCGVLTQQRWRKAQFIHTVCVPVVLVTLLIHTTGFANRRT